MREQLGRTRPHGGVVLLPSGQPGNITHELKRLKQVGGPSVTRCGNSPCVLSIFSHSLVNGTPAGSAVHWYLFVDRGIPFAAAATKAEAGRKCAGSPFSTDTVSLPAPRACRFAEGRQQVVNVLLPCSCCAIMCLTRPCTRSLAARGQMTPRPQPQGLAHAKLARRLSSRRPCC